MMSFQAMPLTDGAPPAQPVPTGRVAHKLGSGMSIRFQILLGFAAIALFAQTIGGTVIFLDARVNTRVEINAAQDMAERLAREAVEHVQYRSDGASALAALTFDLSKIRHVRFQVHDLDGTPVRSEHGLPVIHPYHGDAPSWFLRMIGDAGKNREVPVEFDGERVGTVLVASEAADEVAEIWQDFAVLAIVTMLIDVFILLMLYLATGRILAPLTELAQGLRDLENRRYRIKLPRPRVQELAVISDRFNAVADALAKADARNAELSRRLINAQDEERQHTAMELHDEVGPCIFGLRANLGSISKIAARLPKAEGAQLVARSNEMSDLIDHLQSVNRGVLERLRPMALGHIPITQLLEKLVSEFSGRYPQVDFSLSQHDLAEGYEDSVELTLYRCIQECLTNAVRHASPSKVSVSVAETRACLWRDSVSDIPCLTVAVQDDGVGLDPNAKRGRGLFGIEERVHMLGGRCSIRRLPSGSEVRFELKAASATTDTEPRLVNGRDDVGNPDS